VKLSVITDEIDDDLERALDACDDLGIDAIELRSVDGRNVTELPVDRLEAMHDVLRSRGFSVCAIASPFLKCHRVPAAAATGDVHGAAARTREDQAAVLSEAIRAARILGAPLIRAFSYWREDDPRAIVDELARELGAASAVADAAGLTLAIENEHECNVGTRDELVAVLAAVPRRLGVIWDGGNEAKLSPDAGGSLDGIRGRIVHVHVKDVDRHGNWVRIGEGIVDHAALLNALEESGYSGYISIETHYTKDGSRAEATRECVESLRSIARRR
jgi:sugar phosphate isomerase/epimerase